MKAAKAAVALARKGIDPIDARDREKAANLAAERAKQASHLQAVGRGPLRRSRPRIREAQIRPARLDQLRSEVLLSGPRRDGDQRHYGHACRRGREGRRGETAILRPGNWSSNASERSSTPPLRTASAMPSAAIPLTRGWLRRSSGIGAQDVDVHFRRIELDDAPATFRTILEAVERAHGIRAEELDAWMFMTRPAPGRARRCAPAGAISTQEAAVDHPGGADEVAPRAYRAAQ